MRYEDYKARVERNSSELRGNQESAAFQEGIEAPGPPGPEEGCQGHFAVAARL